MPTDPFAAIAAGRRREILELLRDGERSAGEIARRFEVSWLAVSRHRRMLREDGLLRERRVGRERCYTLDRPRIRRELGSWAAACDAPWEDDKEAKVKG